MTAEDGPGPTGTAGIDAGPGSWFARVPKVELHLHLEGAIPLEALWQLVQKYGVPRDVPDLLALRAKFVYRDFPHFIKTWVWKNQFLREYEDFSFIAEAVARDLRAQNLRYVEAFFSPGDFARFGLLPERLATAIRAGLRKVPGIEIALVADLVRDFGPSIGAHVLQRLSEACSESGIVGIGIGGSEQSYPPEPWQEVYEAARGLGLRTSCHAGEAAGAASVWGAIRALRVDRIGHGTRAVEDPALIEHLAASRIPLEMCPLSNVATGAIACYEAHPIRTLLDAGVVVTVNTDDPRMFGNSLAEEYALLERHHGFDRDEIRELIRSAARAAFLPAERKVSLLAELEADPAWLDDRPMAQAP